MKLLKDDDKFGNTEGLVIILRIVAEVGGDTVVNYVTDEVTLAALKVTSVSE